MKEKYKYTMETKEVVEERKSNIIFEYLGIIASQIGMLLHPKERVCQQKDLTSQIPQEQLKEA